MSSVSHGSPRAFSASGCHAHIDLLLVNQFPATPPDSASDVCRTTHTTPQTTFLNNIFRYLNGGENPMDEAATVVQATGSGIFGNVKTLRIEEREFEYTTEGGQEYKFFLVDTPGYGDHVNASQSFQPVVDNIENGNKRYLAEVKNGNDTPEEDGRTDVCIYFIAAHRFKHIDIKYLKQLCKVVGVIPVIGKSDCMTVKEMKEFKTVIVDLAAQDDEIEFFQFSETSWEQCKLKLRTQGTRNTPDWLGERQPPPYAVISSKVDKSDGSIRTPVPVRSYAWGDCNVMETRNSDNEYLQRLLLEVGFQDIKDKMREHHRAFVIEKGRPRPVVERAGDYVKANRMSTLALVMATLFVLLAVVLVCVRCGMQLCGACFTCFAVSLDTTRIVVSKYMVL
ncbi:unnamed protein product [Ectocarpus sp. 12 AP-2014]